VITRVVTRLKKLVLGIGDGFVKHTRKEAGYFAINAGQSANFVSSFFKIRRCL